MPLAYIDPNTVQHFFGSIGPFLGAVVAILAFLLWPFRYGWRYVRARYPTWPRGVRVALAVALGGTSGLALSGFFAGSSPDRSAPVPVASAPSTPKVLLLGMDGLDPKIMEEMMARGELPNFAKLKETGGYRRLQTSNPAESPVAWSTIATGCGPGEHGIFDFLHRDPKTYLPYLSLRKPVTGLGGTSYEKARKRDGFWVYTSRAGIPTTVIRWPVAFPAEEVTGRFLSGFGVPDLLGGEGRYTFYASAPAMPDDALPSAVVQVDWDGTTAKSSLRGPATGHGSHASLDLTMAKSGKDALTLSLPGDEAVQARLNQWSAWLPVRFRIGFRDVRGQVKFLLTELTPHLKLYASPIHLDPSEQAFPLTCPDCFGAELAAKLGGTFHTLGMPEQIHPLSHKRYEYDAFLAECRAVSEERRRMLGLELARFEQGVLAFVFDTSDRIQHALWATREPSHPAHDAAQASRFAHVIPDTYREMDEILGEVLAKLDSRTVLLVLSDHGFGSFRRAVHVNRWLIENGYMHLKESNEKEGRELFQDVDWSKTKAYAMGFSSIYLNLAEREGEGIVEPGEEGDALLGEISEKLKAWKDSKTGEAIVHETYLASDLYNGPATADAPDLVLGLKPGHRFSWQTALGAAPLPLIEDNTKPWSGDHLIDPSFVPGVVFSNRPIRAETPGLEDIAPTVLDLLGVRVPGHMTGVPFLHYLPQ